VYFLDKCQRLSYNLGFLLTLEICAKAGKYIFAERDENMPAMAATYIRNFFFLCEKTWKGGSARLPSMPSPPRLFLGDILSAPGVEVPDVVPIMLWLFAG
jgi:hypothetical protein